MAIETKTVDKKEIIIDFNNNNNDNNDNFLFKEFII